MEKYIFPDWLFCLKSDNHKLGICSYSLLSGSKHVTCIDCKTSATCGGNLNIDIFSSITFSITNTWVRWPSNSNSSGFSFTSSKNFQTTQQKCHWSSNHFQRASKMYFEGLYCQLEILFKRELHFCIFLHFLFKMSYFVKYCG